ncbi:hypothetical protein, partial [Enterobacter sp.]|uniref:hypothetical protein n=1 Tax=Enterobacter sp. TaxID=42895 RepID=UPI003A948160
MAHSVVCFNVIIDKQNRLKRRANLARACVAIINIGQRLLLFVMKRMPVIGAASFALLKIPG